MRPFTLRPPDFESGASSVFSGSDFVISWKSDTVMKRRPAEVGLNLRTAISARLRDAVGWMASETRAMQGRREAAVLRTTPTEDAAVRRAAGARRQHVSR